jgi:UDP-N-acetylglucosamine:LPS N-acetylglucosamine transferase
VLASAGAAVVIDEKALTADRLASETTALITDAGMRARMAEAMRRFARPDAAARIVDRLLRLAGRREGAGA